MQISRIFSNGSYFPDRLRDLGVTHCPGVIGQIFALGILPKPATIMGLINHQLSPEEHHIEATSFSAAQPATKITASMRKLRADQWVTG